MKAKIDKSDADAIAGRAIAITAGPIEKARAANLIAPLPKKNVRSIPIGATRDRRADEILIAKIDIIIVRRLSGRCRRSR